MKNWAQNSLLSVDTTSKTFKYNYEYYLIKHLSRFVKPGAKRLNTKSLTRTSWYTVIWTKVS